MRMGAPMEAGASSLSIASDSAGVQGVATSYGAIRYLVPAHPVYGGSERIGKRMSQKRRLSSVEGLTEDEQQKMADILVGS